MSHRPATPWIACVAATLATAGPMVAANAGETPVFSGASLEADRVTFTGERFGATQGASVLKLDGVALAIVSWSDTEVTATMPGTTAPGFHSFELDREPGGSAFGGGNVQPSVNRVVPAGGAAGEEVVLEGWFFGDDPMSGDALLFGGASGAPIAVDDADWSPTEIRFTVPDFRAVETEVAVRAAGFPSIGEAAFTLEHVVDAIVPAIAGVGETVTFEGSGFGASMAPGDRVFVNGEPATILSWSGDEIEVRVPFAACDGEVSFVQLEGGLAAIAPIFTLAPPAPIDGGTVDLSGGSPLGDGDMAFPEGATVTIRFEADPGLAATVELAGVSLPVEESPTGTYTATYLVDPDAGDYPGEGDHDVTLSVTNGCDTANLTAPVTVTLDTVPPAITLLRRNNNPPPGQGDVYLPGDTVELLVRGTEASGAADFFLVSGENVVPTGTGTRVGMDHILALTVFGGVSGDWQIRAVLRDVAGNTTELVDDDPDDLVRIGADGLPSIVRVLATPGGAARGDSLGVGATLTVRAASASTGADAAEALFVNAAGAVVARHDLPSTSPDGGAGEVRAFEATLDAEALADGDLRLDVVICDSATLPGACAAEDGCNCRRLAERVFHVDTVPPVVSGLTLGRTPSTTIECDPIGVADGVTLHVTVTAAGGVSGLDAGADVAGTEIALVETTPGTYEGELAITSAFAEGERPVTAWLDDGVSRSELATAGVVIDHTPPTAPSVKTTAEPGTPITPGDVLAIIVTAGEPDLVATVTLGDRLVDVPMVETSPGVHTLDWLVPEEMPGRAQTLPLEVTLSDCASSVTTTGTPVELTTVTPIITEVLVEGDCLSIADSVSVFVSGSPGMPSGRVWLISQEGEPIGDPVSLTERDGRYEARFQLSPADSTRVRELQDQGLVIFRVLAELERSASLVSAPATSDGFILVDRSSGPITVAGVGEDGHPLDDRLVVPDHVFTLSGERGAEESVWMRLDGVVVPLAPVNGSDQWVAEVDLADFGVAPTDDGPFDAEVYGRACGADGPITPYTLTVDRVAPSASGYAVLANGEPIDITAPVSEGITLVVRATGQDDGSTLGAEIVLWTGDPDAGGTVREVIPMSPVAGRGGATTFEGTIEGTRFDLGGLRFETRITDGANVAVAGTSAPPVATAAVRTDRIGSFFVPGDEGEGGIAPGQWHLFSVPAVLETTSSVTVFANLGLGEPSQSTWRLLRWLPSGDGPDGSYVSSEPGAPLVLTPGAAYWLQWRTPTPRAHVFDLGPGHSVPLGPQNLELLEGWNLIATPFASPTAWPDGAPTLRRWRPAASGYSATDDGRAVLEPFTGYFVYASARQTVTLDPTERPAEGPSPTHPAGFHQVDGAWSVRIRLDAPHGVDALNYAAVHPHGTAGLDELDLGEVPAPERGVTLTLVPTDAPDARLAADVRGPAGLTRWNLHARSAVAAPDAAIVVEGVSRVPAEYDVVLLEDRTGRAVDLRADDRLATSLLAGPATRYTLLVGDPERVRTEIAAARPPVPRHLTLGVPFPNPFGSGTRIDLALPEASDVTLAVHDVSGREVRGIRLRGLGAGAHTQVWDGRDDRGRPVPAGVYFLRVSGAGETRIRKLVRIGEEARR